MAILFCGLDLQRDVGAGAAYGTAKSGIGIAGVGTFRPDLIMKVQTKGSTNKSLE